MLYTTYQIVCVPTHMWKHSARNNSKFWPLMPCFHVSSHCHQQAGYWLSNYNMPLPFPGWIGLNLRPIDLFQFSINVVFFNSSSPGQNDHHSTDDILLYILKKYQNETNPNVVPENLNSKMCTAHKYITKILRHTQSAAWRWRMNGTVA